MSEPNREQLDAAKQFAEENGLGGRDAFNLAALLAAREAAAERRGAERMREDAIKAEAGRPAWSDLDTQRLSDRRYGFAVACAKKAKAIRALPLPGDEDG